MAASTNKINAMSGIIMVVFVVIFALSAFYLYKAFKPGDGYEVANAKDYTDITKTNAQKLFKSLKIAFGAILALSIVGLGVIGFSAYKNNADGAVTQADTFTTFQ